MCIRDRSTLAGKTDKYVGMRTGDADFKKADAAGFSIPAYTATSKLMVFCAAAVSYTHLVLVHLALQ